MLPDSSRELTGTPDDFAAGCRRDMQRARAEAGTAKASGARDPIATLRAFDAAFAALGEAASRASLARNVHPDPRMRDCAEAAEQEVDALSTELSLDRGLYDALSALDVSGEDGATRYLVTKSLRDFRRAGVDRDDATRARVRALREELVRIGQEFGRNIKDDVRRIALDPAELDGLPDDWRRTHPPRPHRKV
jgi:thimet oligopeptidase